MSTTGWAQYVLEDDYFSGNFFDQFSFWDTTDPTDGFVAYQNQAAAQNQSLVESSSGNVKLKVDSTSVTPNGRPSVRLTSNKSYQYGHLVILDIDHMPGGICGTWPAFWMVGPDWPNQGEIDIIEGVNDDMTNDMTLHTGASCSITNNNAFSGSINTLDCVSSNANDQGCQIDTSDTQTYGSGFNAINGGVYAMEWTSSAISVFFFPRSSIPSDVTSGSPSPSSWGKPLAQFQGGCDVATAFTSQQIVFDTTFCGNWAGEVWSGSSCASSTNTDTCDAYVQNNPSAFADAYWSINALKVYQNGGGSSPSSSAAAPSYTPSTSSWGGVSQTTFSVSTVSTGMHSVPAPSASASYPFSNTTDGPSSSASASAWAPTVTSSSIVASAAPSSVSSAAPEPSSPPETTSAPASQTWTGQPWQSSWAEHSDGSGGYAVGEPAKVKERHARHLRYHQRHGAGRL